MHRRLIFRPQLFRCTVGLSLGPGSTKHIKALHLCRLAAEFFNALILFFNAIFQNRRFFVMGYLTKEQVPRNTGIATCYTKHEWPVHSHDVLHPEVL